jgi:transcriptional regulator with XRE-family HTH domain
VGPQTVTSYHINGVAAEEQSDGQTKEKTEDPMSNRGTTPGFSLTFAELLKELLDGTGESCRRLAKKSGLSHSAISKYLGGGVRPSRDACIALADHFGINPNEMLEAAGYKSLAFFEKGPLEPGQVSRDIEELAAKVDQIANPRMRRRVIEAVKNLLDIYLALEGNA